MRAALIEDSELARFELEYQLRAHPQIEIVGQAGCGRRGCPNRSGITRFGIP